MATFYYRNAPSTNGDWNSLGNWWMAYNAGTDTLSVPATSLPGAADDVVLLGTDYWAVSRNSGSTPTVRDVTVLSGTLSIPLTATGTIRFYNGTYLLGDPGDVSGTWPSGTLTGNIEMHQNSSTTDGSTSHIAIVGNFSLYDYAVFNTINITGNATFYDESSLIGLCNFSGDVVFNDDSYSAGWLISFNSVTYNDRSSNSGSDVGYFEDPSGQITFNDSSWTFNGSGLSAVIITFNHNSHCRVAGNFGGGIVGDVIFNDSSHSGEVGETSGLGATGNVTYRHSSWNEAPVSANTVTYTDRTPYPIPRGINGSNILGVI